MSNNRQIERRVRYLEHLILERSVGRGGPSIAMNIWQFLMDNGPATRDEIDTALGSRYSNTTALNSWVKPGLITKQGDRYVANPNYVWDDVGVIQRDIPQNLLHLQDSEVANLEPADNVGSRKSTTSRARKPKAAPIVTPNMFSNKLAEVKAAVEAGESVNQLNDKRMSPLIKATTSRAASSEEIAIYLIEHDADLTYTYKGRDALTYAIRNNKYDVAQAIIDKDERLSSLHKIIVAVEADWPINKLSMFVTDATIREASSGVINRCVIYINSASLNSVQNSYDDIQRFTDLFVDKLFKYKQINLIESALRNEHITPGSMAIGRSTVKNGWLPFMYNGGVHLFVRELKAQRSYINELCTMAKMYIDGKLKSNKQYLLSWMYLLDAIRQIEPNREKLYNEFLTTAADQEFVNSLGSNVWSVFADLIESNLDFAKHLAKFKFPSLNNSSASTAVTPFIVNKSLPKEAVRLLCAKIRKSLKMPLDSLISQFYINSLTKINDAYIINFLIDIGLGPAMAGQYFNGMSDACKDALSDGGFFNNRTTTTVNSSRIGLIKEIIRCVEDDTMHASLRRAILNDTSLLFEPAVVDAIEDHPDSITGRQLKRIADENQPEKDVYDF